ncbi:MAG: spermidine synthase, partial [Actinomycetia bacterium]|nr:spermidine synthase [Actinomycetes bacterium]
MDKDDKWFCEPVTEGFEHKYRIKKTIEKRKTKYQEIEIFDTVSFGRMLVLDGAVQTSEDDEHYYHEMLVHIPMLTHQKPETVLIIGGGDGGALRRVLEHPVKKVIHVELDKDVVKTCLKHLP